MVGAGQSPLPGTIPFSARFISEEGLLWPCVKVRPLLPCAPRRRPNADPHPCPVRGLYCVDENTERRNHYLDLAGIENYTSKFGPGRYWVGPG